MPYNRRTFLQTLAMAGAAIPLRSFAFAANDWEIHGFSKPFQFKWMDFGMLCQTFAAAGLQGVDYTVRPEGHVTPERVAEDLPKAVAAAKNAGISAKLMTTAIQDASDPATEAVLRAAAKEGIQYYRMGWYDYEKGKPLQESIRKRAGQLKALGELNKKLNIKAAYQNHSGLRMGAAVWDLYEMIKDADPAWTGVQYDIRHATVEGAASWPLGLQLISPHINTIVIKDVRWKLEKGKYVLENVPLGEGMVDFKAYFKKIKELGLKAPISLHLEYPLLNQQETLLPDPQKQQIVQAKLKKDVDTLKGWLAAM
ncbi:sugar phosphate isomerase/epimerase family protein [Chitinophaga sp. GCM10012297]|uniref:TIM barrel protein n=1 Tax=Chitinophaga chungangae TaxID=2821488 RepID=A0ABS3YEI0_9BACT|nr:TIM barrel protein [Chitinophaga chungangae]MBO9152529.1 TIM barrel protein [Chitinophaga chungangae]